MPIGYTYILECSDGSYYTGSTIDIDDRITKHQNGQGQITQKNVYQLN
ncbi:GIY-YIG nuclease family protein [Winogradskyella pulchriflava]|uniref:GIY-YIG nuclease family protein n=1 Tax=Winogradskyella pulchriflava TaxID=1110688 RepID=A0ABV6Q3Z8_9FLAO